MWGLLQNLFLTIGYYLEGRNNCVISLTFSTTSIHSFLELFLKVFAITEEISTAITRRKFLLWFHLRPFMRKQVTVLCEIILAMYNLKTKMMFRIPDTLDHFQLQNPQNQQKCSN